MTTSIPWHGSPTTIAPLSHPEPVPFDAPAPCCGRVVEWLTWPQPSIAYPNGVVPRYRVGCDCPVSGPARHGGATEPPTPTRDDTPGPENEPQEGTQL